LDDLFALGLILREFGVSLKAYLASASVVGLAIGCRAHSAKRIRKHRRQLPDAV
jgi:hypothetical protein